MRGLGELEAAVMDVLWRLPGPHRVRDVLEQLAPERKLAYTTVMTVLDNLHRKGWVCREMDGRAYRYLPSASREEVTARALRDLLDSSGDVEAVLLHFARSVSARESEVLLDALSDAGPGSAEEPRG
ncbi:BlaI/MecI/CopY family transcriptional regulator [Pseudonocardia acidicola]|uniref:BlaI/MecI/CopY family transcriptional regulator n=1 Tax=Pseudonocardia acidicola TaxID=2724939 RepID=A0ABX1SKL8_9PSEU|nr:BlaI/MecI/CopY family transcriptional regulator [Pseudonocardia acidicola]NMI01520.1 BlaI/MecI/CopY family transcriptional regulator [Pseudonocardia acidicola]